MKINGTAADDTLVGTDEADVIGGRAGNDRLIGGLGRDRLIGGDGADILLGDAEGESIAGGDDVLVGGAGNDFLSGGQGDDVAFGDDGNDVLTNASVGGVSEFFDTFSFYAIEGPTGIDRFDGGRGRDTLYLYYDFDSGPLSFALAAPDQTSVMQSHGETVGSVTGVELLHFGGGNGDDVVTGGAGNDVLSGNGGNDTLTGGDGNDQLDGWTGRDVLSGGNGDDIIGGGEGDDILSGGAGYDIVAFSFLEAAIRVDLRISGRAQDTGEGRDTLSGFEGISVDNPAGYAATLIGNGVDNRLFATGSGDRTLIGNRGDDDLRVTSDPFGDPATIMMSGGTGNDRLIYEDGGFNQPRFADRVTLIGGDGDDVIRSSGGGLVSIAAGAGDDRITIDAMTTTNRVNLGGGHDVLTLTRSMAVDQPSNTIVVREFDAGVGGDVFRLGDWAAQLPGFGPDGRLFADGYARLVQRGEDTLLQIDRDAAGTDHAWRTLVAFRDVQAEAFVARNFEGQGHPVVVNAQPAPVPAEDMSLVL